MSDSSAIGESWSNETAGDYRTWLRSVYLPILSTEKAAALEQLHSATNWGISLLSVVILTCIARPSFPDLAALYMCSGALVVGMHSYLRAVKGYINVIRWMLLQRLILLDNGVDETRRAIQAYHVHWALPLRRADVFVKGLGGLGFGYLLGLVAIMVCVVVARVPMTVASAAVVCVGVLLCLVELASFLRSPYMRKCDVSEAARSLR